uniref:Uncharacterized protein n=1 Tax=Glossina austeni TaxID=7395 RepID=A0A1A9UZP2_GLOAU
MGKVAVKFRTLARWSIINMQNEIVVPLRETLQSEIRLLYYEAYLFTFFITYTTRYYAIKYDVRVFKIQEAYEAYVRKMRKNSINTIEEARRSNAWAESNLVLLKLQLHGGRFKLIKKLKASINNSLSKKKLGAGTIISRIMTIHKLLRSFNELPCKANCFCSEEMLMLLMRLHQHQPKI